MGLFTRYTSTTEARGDAVRSGPGWTYLVVGLFIVVVAGFGISYERSKHVGGQAFLARCSAKAEAKRCEKLLDANGGDCSTYAFSSGRNGQPDKFDDDAFYACVVLSKKTYLERHGAEAQASRREQRPPKGDAALVADDDLSAARF